jgi:nucleotide-binding universal stress UspA family protein
VTPTGVGAEKSEYRRSFRLQAEAALGAYLASRAEDGISWTPVVKAGDPRMVVLTEISRRGSDLLVLGTHARSGMAHALLGSVAAWVVSAAPCDVLVARPVRFSFGRP